MNVQVLDRELDRLEGLWEQGLSDTYRSYLETVGDHEPEMQPKLALIEGLSTAAASGKPSRPVRELLVHALSATA